MVARATHREVHHNKEAFDAVMDIIEAHWNANQVYGREFNEDDFLTDDDQWILLHYWPSDPQEAKEWEGAYQRFRQACAAAGI